MVGSDSRVAPVLEEELKEPSVVTRGRGEGLGCLGGEVAT